MEERVVRVPGSFASPSGDRWALTVVGKSFDLEHKISQDVYQGGLVRIHKLCCQEKSKFRRGLSKSPKLPWIPERAQIANLPSWWWCCCCCCCCCRCRCWCCCCCCFWEAWRHWLGFYLCHAHLSTTRFIASGQLVQQFHEHVLSWPSTTLPQHSVPPKQAVKRVLQGQRQPRTGWRGWSTRTTWSTGRFLWTRSLRPAYPWSSQLLEIMSTLIWQWNFHDFWWFLMIIYDHDSMMIHANLWWCMLIFDDP